MSARTGRRARRAARGARPRGRASVDSAGRRRAAAPGCTSIACSRSAAPGTVVTGHAVVGPDRSAATSSCCCRAAAGPACAACRCTTSRSTRAPAGQRVALNLTGVSVDEVRRGDVVVAGGVDLRATAICSTRSSSSAAASPSTATGSRSTTGRARLPPGWPGWAAASGRSGSSRRWSPPPGDRLVVRQIAPPDTLGGGVVLDARPRKHGPSRDLLVRLERLSRGGAARTTRRPHAGPGQARRAPRPPAGAAVGLRARARETPARGRLRAAAGLRARRRRPGGPARRRPRGQGLKGAALPPRRARRDPRAG